MSSPCTNCGADLRVCIECDWYNGVWISKDQYEARLKADKVAMLTELQLEIGEIVKEEELIDNKWARGLHYSKKIIQQKINALREGEL